MSSPQDAEPIWDHGFGLSLTQPLQQIHIWGRISAQARYFTLERGHIHGEAEQESRGTAHKRLEKHFTGHTGLDAVSKPTAVWI